MLTATITSYGNRQISTSPPQNRYLWTDRQKLSVDYVHETPYTKFGTNPPTEGFWANIWNITKILYLFIYTFFLRLAYRSDLLMDFFTRDSSKDVKSRKLVPFFGSGLGQHPKKFGNPLFISATAEAAKAVLNLVHNLRSGSMLQNNFSTKLSRGWLGYGST